MKKALSLLLAVAVAVAAVCAWNWLRDNRLPAFGGGAELYVTPEMTPQDVVAQLEEQVQVRWPGRLERVFEKHRVQEYLTPGHYVLEPGRTAAYLARMLNNGWQTPVRVVLAGSLRLRGEIADKVSAQLLVDSAAVRQAMDDPAFLKPYGFTPAEVFGLIVPDTYEMYWTDDMAAFFDRQKQAYDRFWNAERRDKAARLGLTPKQVSVVASIVNGETNYVPEMPKIAGVYLNRLKQGMKLQADPTVAFCFDYSLSRIYLRHLEVDSPYNTYRYAGLPPGPIAVPTRDALEAVLNPDRGGGNLYFCADPSFNGTHRFARTYTEHLRNARAFQQALNQRNSASPAR